MRSRPSSVDFMLLLQITVIILLNSPFVRGRHTGGSKGIVKTIKVGNEDVVDCMDVHKQLALTHPLLLNHRIQMEPSMHANISKSDRDETVLELKQSWQKYGRCPQGSIPISRKYSTYNSSILQRKLSPFAQAPSNNHQYAMINFKAPSAGRINGAHGVLNVWNPVVNPLGLSISQIWIIAGDDTNRNTIEVGWRVYPADGQNHPRLFVYWTRDNYKSTGCYDLTCPGFVQTNKDWVAGAYVDPISVYGGIQMEIALNVKKDLISGNWWLNLGGVDLGYWPFSLFTSMAENGGDLVAWGGEVTNAMAQDNHTLTQMGSGHFSTEGFQKSSFIRDIKYVDKFQSEIYPTQDDLQFIASAPACYDCRLDVHNTELRLFFVGPGCQVS